MRLVVRLGSLLLSLDLSLILMMMWYPCPKAYNCVPSQHLPTGDAPMEASWRRRRRRRTLGKPSAADPDSLARSIEERAAFTSTTSALAAKPTVVGLMDLPLTLQ